MDRIGVRELRQHASRWLARVQAGESFEITDRGRLVAVLGPPRASRLDRLVESGRLVPPTGTVAAVLPLAVDPRGPTASDILRELRDEERA